MQSRIPPALLIARLNAAPGRKREFENWYTHVHLRDVLRMQGSVSAQRFWQPRPHPTARQPSEFTYLTVYDVDDAEALTAAHTAAAGTDRLVMSAAADLREVSVHYYNPQVALDPQSNVSASATGALLIEFPTADQRTQREAARLLNGVGGTLPNAALHRGLLVEYRADAQMFRRPPAATLLCLLQFSCEPNTVASRLDGLLDRTAHPVRITLFERASPLLTKQQVLATGVTRRETQARSRAIADPSCEWTQHHRSPETKESP